MQLIPFNNNSNIQLQSITIILNKIKFIYTMLLIDAFNTVGRYTVASTTSGYT